MYSIFLAFAWISTFNSYSSCDTYTNQTGEMIAFCGDSIVYRLKDEGAFISYTGNVGCFKKRRNKIKINYTYYPFVSKEVIIDTTQSDKTTLTLLYNDLQPIQYAYVDFIYNKKKTSILSDALGCVIVPTSFLDKDILIKVRHLRDKFEYHTRLEVGSVNKIISLAHAEYAMCSTKECSIDFLKVDFSSEEKLNVYSYTSKQWKNFYKVNKTLTFKDAIDYVFRLEMP